MKSLKGWIAWVFILGLIFSRPLFAALSDDDTSTGTPLGMAGGVGPAIPEEEETEILTEAAEALDETHPELAAKLRAMAVKEQTEHESAEVHKELAG